MSIQNTTVLYILGNLKVKFDQNQKLMTIANRSSNNILICFELPCIW